MGRRERLYRANGVAGKMRLSAEPAASPAALGTAAVKPPLDNACSCPAAGDTVELAHAQWGTSQEAGCFGQQLKALATEASS